MLQVIPVTALRPAATVPLAKVEESCSSQRTFMHFQVEPRREVLQLFYNTSSLLIRMIIAETGLALAIKQIID